VSISTADIKALREATGAGVLDSKKALELSDGNVEQAKEYLRKKGLDAASKKATREAKDGLVSAKLSDDGKVGVLLEVNCETDFVARTDDFKNFVNALGQQVLADSNLATAEALLAAPYLNDTSKTVSQQLTEMVAKLGENMIVRKVARFSLTGEGILSRYIHPGNRVGVLLEATGNPTDKAKFAQVVHDVALQIAAASPEYVSRADIPAEVMASKKTNYQAQLAEEKKPDNVKERIIEGKFSKWYSEVVLVDQEFVKDNSLTIAKLLESYSQQLGVEVKISRFARFELGAN